MGEGWVKSAKISGFAMGLWFRPRRDGAPSRQTVSIVLLCMETQRKSFRRFCVWIVGLGGVGGWWGLTRIRGGAAGRRMGEFVVSQVSKARPGAPRFGCSVRNVNLDHSPCKFCVRASTEVFSPMMRRKSNLVVGVQKLTFSSEVSLQQAIAGLLARLPGVRSVQILQGAQEVGKDIVFYSMGPLGESLPCACVVKNHPITGRVASSKGARTVLLQAQQAFDSPFFDGTGAEVWVQRVYILTPGNMGQESVASIRGRLKDRAGQVIFICGPDLFDLFKRWWPDFMPEEASALSRHFSSTAVLLADNPISNVAALYSIDLSTKPAEHVYVAQDFARRFPHLTLLSPESFFPTERRLFDQWTRREVEEARDQLRELSRYLSLAAQWGYTTAKPASGGEIGKSLDAFSSLLQSSFGEALRREYKPTRAEVPNVGPDASVRLDGFPALRDAQRALIGSLDKALAPLTNAHELYDRFIPCQRSGSGVMDDPNFLEACALADFYQVAPNLFIELPEPTEIVIPRTIVETWHRPLLIVGAAGSARPHFADGIL